jgi:hypothetical protein
MKNFFQKTIKENVLTTHQNHKKDLTYFYHLRVKNNHQKENKIKNQKNINYQNLENNIQNFLTRLIPEKIKNISNLQKTIFTKLLTNIKNQNYKQMKNPIKKINTFTKKIFSFTPRFLAGAMMMSLVFSFLYNPNISYADTTAPTVAQTGVNVLLRSGQSSGVNTVRSVDAGGVSTIYAKRQNFGSLSLRPMANLTGLTVNPVTSGSVSNFTFNSSTYLYPSVTTSAPSHVTVTPVAAGSTITVNGTPVASGAASGNIAVSGTTSSITIVVTRPGHLDVTYVIRVTKSPGDPTPSGGCLRVGSGSTPYIYRCTSNGSINLNGASTSNGQLLVVGGGGGGGNNYGTGGNAGAYNYQPSYNWTGTGDVIIGSGGGNTAWNSVVSSTSSSFSPTTGGVQTAAGGANGTSPGAQFTAGGSNGLGVSGTSSSTTPRGANGIPNSITGTQVYYAAGGDGYAGSGSYGSYTPYSGNNNPNTTGTSQAPGPIQGANTGSAGSAMPSFSNQILGASGIVVVSFNIESSIAQVTSTPTFSNSGLGGNLVSTTTISASTAGSTGGACIAYTTDGSTPTASSNATNTVGGNITLSNLGPVLIRAIAYSGARSGANCTGTPSVESRYGYVDDFSALITAKNAFIIQSNAVSNTNYSATVPAINDINDGVYDVVSVDAAGNQSSNAVSGWLTVDNTDPDVSISSPLNNSYSSSSGVNLSGTASDTNLSTVQISVNGGAYVPVVGTTNWTYSATGLSDGINTFAVRATDSAGNVATTSVLNVTVDTSGPTVALTYNKTSPFNAGVVRITATYTDASASLVGTPTISINQPGSTDISNATMTSSSAKVWYYDYNVNTANGGAYIDGTATVTLNTVTDLAGNNSSAATNNTFVIDTSGPTVALTYNKTSPFNAGVVRITATYTDASASLVGTPTISINQPGSTDISNATMTSSSAKVWYYDYNVNTANGGAYIDGTATVTLNTVTDLAGNNSSAATNNTFVIDTSGPDVIISTTSTNPTNTSPIPLTITFEDPVTGFIEGDITVSGANLSGFTGSGATYTVNATPTGNGTINININSGVAFDSATNPNDASNNFSILYDAAAPTVSVNTLCSINGNGCTLSGASANPPQIYSMQSVSGSAADTGGSNLSKVEISIRDRGVGGGVNGNYYNGTNAFSSATEEWISATGTSTWSYSTAGVPFEIGRTYAIRIRSEDGATNKSSIEAVSFVSTNAPPTLFNVTANPVQHISNGTISMSYSAYDIESSNLSVSLFYDSGIVVPVGGMTAGATSVTVSNASLFPSAGHMLIDNEIIAYTKSGNVLSLTRGSAVNYEINPGNNTTNQTTPASHSANAKIYLYGPSATGDYGYISKSAESAPSADKSFVWDARADAPGLESSGMTIRLLVNDGASGEMVHSVTSNTFAFDQKAPNANVYFNAGEAGITNSATVYIEMPTDISTVEYRISDHSSNDPISNSGWVAITQNTNIPWSFDSGFELKRINYEFRDSRGNVTGPITVTGPAPVVLNSLTIQDVSNVTTSYYAMYVGWNDANSVGTYRLERASSDDNITYSAYSVVNMGGSLVSSGNGNYHYLDVGLDTTKFYRYRLSVVTGSNISVFVQATVRPDGVQNYGEGGGGSVATAPRVENVVPTQDSSTKNISVSYLLTDLSFDQKTSPPASYEAAVFYNIGITTTGNLSGGSLPVSNTSRFSSSGGYIQINNEVLSYSGKSGNSLTGIVRGTWPNAPRQTRINATLFTGSPVWIMGSSPVSVSASGSIKTTGQSGTISWDAGSDVNLAGASYANTGIRVLVHDGQSREVGPLSSQSDFSEIGILEPMDLSVPTISFDQATSEVGEGDGSVNIGVTLSRAYPIAITAGYVYTASTNSASAQDYSITANASPITFTAGQTQKNITVSIVDDLIQEGPETVTLTFTDPSRVTNGGNASHVLTITDNDATPTVGFDTENLPAISGDENTAGTITIPVKISNASNSNVDVTYTLTGSAVLGSDYTDNTTTVSSGVIRIPSGQTTRNIVLNISGDNIFEPNETIIVTLSSPVGATLDANTVYTYTIINDDAKPTASFASASASGNENTSPVSVSVNLSNPSSSVVRINYSATGSADAEDYDLGLGYIDIPAGQTSANISLIINNTPAVKSSRTVILSLSPADSDQASASAGAFTYTINADANTIVSFGETVFSLGAENISPVSIPVYVSNTATEEITVSYIVSGTATSGVDFTALSGSVTIPANSNSGNISITINDDALDENNETIIITLSNVTSGPAVVSTINKVYTYTIEDNDDAPAVGFSSGSVSRAENATPLAYSIPVTLSSASGKTITVDYVIEDTGTATKGADFVASYTGTLTFAPGVTSSSVNINIVNDTIPEPTETIIVSLSNPTNATLGTTEFIYSIENDDSVSVGFSLNSSSGLESVASPEIMVSIVGISDQDVTVSYRATVESTATSPADYSFGSSSVTILAGNSSVAIPLSIVDDQDIESNETIVIELFDPVNASLNTGKTIHTYTILNNDLDTTPPTITLSGDNPLSWIKGVTPYVDPGATISDAVDGTCTLGSTSVNPASGTCRYSVSGTVNVDSIASYQYIYTARDSAGNISTITRTVNVVYPEFYQITSSAGANGSISPAGSANIVPVSGTATYVITPNEGYQIGTVMVVGNNGSNSGTAVSISLPSLIVNSENANARDFTFTNVVRNASISVTFVVENDTTPPTLVFNDVRVSAVEGEVNTFTMDVLKGSTYSAPAYTASDNVTAVENISVTISPSTVSTANKTSSPIEVTYTLRDDASPVQNTAVYKLRVNVILAPTYNVALTINGGNRGTVSFNSGNVSSGNIEVASSSTPVFTFTPSAGFKVSALSVDGNALDPVLNASSYTFGAIEKDMTMVVTFATASEIKPTITLVGNGENENDPYIINTGTQAWVEPGFTATVPNTDTSEGAPATIDVSGFVNVDYASVMTLASGAAGSAGVIEVKYSINHEEYGEAEKIRYVRVNDVTPPTIVLDGQSRETSVPYSSTTFAMVAWMTSEPANRKVFYSTSPTGPWSETTLDTRMDSTHLVVIDGLVADRDYYYYVRSVDVGGNYVESSITPPASFSTAESNQVVIISSVGIDKNVFDALQSDYNKLKADARQRRTEAPVITKVEVSDITAFGAMVTFETDVETIASVDYGRTKTFANSEASFVWTKKHEVKISGLRAGTKYFYRIKVVDDESNPGFSEDVKYDFTTKFFSENLEEAQSIDNIEQFQNEIENAIESILPSLVAPFVERPVVTNITEDSATVTFKTNIKAYPLVSYATEAYYLEGRENPYNGEISDTREKNNTHTLELTGLKPNTKYNIMAKAFSLPQVMGRSGNITFTTKSPGIRASVVNRTRDGFSVVWNTLEPATSIVEYRNMRTGRIDRKTDENMNTSHSVKIENLTPGTTYRVTVSGVNRLGNLVEGLEALNVTTSTDITPPAISRIKVDSALVFGRTDRTQTIISWRTDEPATTVVYYEEGSGAPDKKLANKYEDKELSLNHTVMLTTLRPGQVYRFQIASTDSAQNETILPVRTIITPRPNESIVDVIFKNFNETFNFINNVR